MCCRHFKVWYKSWFMSFYWRGQTFINAQIFLLKCTIIFRTTHCVYKNCIKCICTKKPYYVPSACRYTARRTKLIGLQLLFSLTTVVIPWFHAMLLVYLDLTFVRTLWQSDWSARSMKASHTHCVAGICDIICTKDLSQQSIRWRHYSSKWRLLMFLEYRVARHCLTASCDCHVLLSTHFWQGCWRT